MALADSSTKTSNKERSKRSISLENFGQKKGHVRALEEFRIRKEKKRVATAKVLRKYKKTMKHEGYEAGSGASRKRKADDSVFARDANSNGDVNPEEASGKNSRRRKINPLIKSLDKAKLKREEAEKRVKDRENNLKEKASKIRERKRQSKLLAKRTKRGQPIMKHTVDSILKKLQRDT